MKKQIIRNISTEKRFFEIIGSMPNPVMNLYSEKLHSNIEASTIGEAYNKNGVCLYRYIPELTGRSKFETKFKALKKDLNA